MTSRRSTKEVLLTIIGTSILQPLLLFVEITYFVYQANILNFYKLLKKMKY